MKKGSKLIIGIISVAVIVCICVVAVVFVKPAKEGYSMIGDTRLE